MIKVVLDAMGGDHAPCANLEGVKLAVERGVVDQRRVLLTGPQQVLAPELAALGLSGCEIIDAPDVLTCNDTPVDAMRRKPNNSISLGIRAVAERRAAGFISAGSTGVVVAAASVGLPRLEGIRRPGIAVAITGEGGVPFVVVDVGANPQPKAVDLLQYAIMGSAYYRGTLGNDRPRVGLLNIGTEDTKGNPLTKEAALLLREAPINFVGNVEGVDVFAGRCDVVVCDGFTGNVLLKVSEGCAEYLLRTTASFMREAGIDGRQVLQKLKQRVDYSEYGGAQLLGVDGGVTICHGRSGPEAICNAIRFALRAAGAEVNHHIVTAARAAAAS
ncbi:MAG TPA: phosphate acyltransferase PlsX [Planctomycetota bacterium]|nr:phosphate acyltransferase PlsX [Planctomycetota bacterium]